MSLIQDKFIASIYLKANGSVPASADQAMGGFKITGLGTPTDPTDAVTKAYADASSGAVSSVFSRTGAVVATSGDYTTAQVTESGNLYFTDARAIAALLTGFTAGAGTVSATDSILQAIQKIVGNVKTHVKETPSGTINGSNAVFTLSFSPVSASLAVFVDGILDNAYSLSTNTITFTTAPALGQTVFAMYVK